MDSREQGRRTVLLLVSTAALAYTMGCSDSETEPSGGGGNGSGGNGSGGNGSGGNGSGGNGNGGMGGEPGTGGMGGDPGTGGQGGGSVDCTGGATAMTIVDNHMPAHTVMTIPSADIAAGTDVTYDLTSGGGMGGHTHTVTVTAADFTTLATTGTVTVISSMGGNSNHTHAITFTCG